MMDRNPQNSTLGGASASPRPATPETLKTAPSDSLEALPGNSDITLPMVIAEWPKNARETVRITLSEYQRRPVVDCRVWYEAKDGELKPSPKGLTLALAHLPALADGIAKALQVARHHGLVEGGES